MIFRILDYLVLVCILIVAAAIVGQLCYSSGYNHGWYIGYSTGKEMGIEIQQADNITDLLRSVSRENLDNLKADAYTAGMLDGRASILNEQSGSNIKPIGVPEGYTSNRTLGWREYADCITYNKTCYDYPFDEISGVRYPYSFYSPAIGMDDPDLAHVQYCDELNTSQCWENLSDVPKYYSTATSYERD